MSTVTYRRRPRKPGPALPSGDLELEPPPDLPAPPPRNIAQLLMILPMLAMVGAMMLLFSGRIFSGGGGGGGFNSGMLVVGGLFGVAMVGMVGMSFTRGGQDAAEMTNSRRDYMRYLAQSRRKVRRAGDQQREAMRWRHPDPSSLWTLGASARLWERRPTDTDFGEVRVAVGTQQLSVVIKTPETKPVEDLEPMSAMALRRFVKAQSTVSNIPIALQLRAFRRVYVRGDHRSSRGLVRAMLSQLATFHAPEDLCLAVVADPGRRRDWEWLKWLPHANHREELDAVGARRLIVGSMSELEGLLAAQLADRNRFQKNVSPIHEGVHVVVVHDGGEVSGNSMLTGAGVSGTTVIEFNPQLPRRLQPWMLCLEVDHDKLVMTQPGGSVDLGRPDWLSVVSAAALARQLSKFRLATVTTSAEEPLAVSMELPDLLGIGDAGAVDPRHTWKDDRPNAQRLTIPIGLDPNGSKVFMDFKEAAQGGMGPHGLVIGATGSGKSEMLRTIVTALAVTHSSQELNFVLVDFKGGATFATLDRLPHTSAVITNLEDELHLVDRMADAINGEMIRRQELLRDAGNYVSQRDYERARRAGAALAPLPSLLIICDEFSELLSAQPDFIDLFVMIGRLGRSLGVHLLLASQRLEEGRLRGLDSHLSYRIGLRTFSAMESRTVLGVPDAYELPQAPGHGYMKIDTDTMLRFRSAYVSGEYRTAQISGTTVQQDGTVARTKVLPYGVEHQPLPPEALTPDEEPEPDEEQLSAEDDPTKETMMSVITSRLEGQGPPAHQVWLPPLEESPSLDQIFTRLAVDGERGLHAPDWPQGSLHVPMGWIDKPFEQRRDLLTFDLSGAGGNMVVVGGPQTGKSTTLRSLIGAMSLCHTPAETQFYCVDTGGGSLRGLADLPHVGGVGSKQKREVVRRVIAQVQSIIDDREARFADLGVETMAGYRTMRARGEVDDPLGDVFLVIDGWQNFKEDFEPLDDDVLVIAQQGGNFGVHLVLSCNRWMDMRPVLRDLMGTRVELKLSDEYDSEIDRKAQKNIPERAPGRGIIHSGHAILSALPRVDGSSSGDDLADGVARFVAASAEAWKHAPAEPIRLLPRELPITELPEPVPARPLPIGVDEARLEPVGVDLSMSPHLLIVGDTECGKTNLLRVFTEQLAKTREQNPTKVLMIDYRRTLLGEVDEELIGEYAAGAEAANEAALRLANSLRNRLPGPDVTPEQLRGRDWWTGPEIYVLVDDYDIVSTQSPDPLAHFVDLLPQARDIGFHLIVTRHIGGISRAMYQNVIQRLTELQTPVLMMSGPREEGAVFGNVRPLPQPPGRGLLIKRDGNSLIQTAWSPSRFGN
ncbi:type VII secretion protein EccC [Stackebrandtia nassauensis]|uniref:Cell division FtsK/SpoIIIE n=1 Tax=Stackebrandtia nassauensis (strain DSM 44728 / CIP 108903 / NRRL B-16338 / NBRC 102104 / LLR-40K-21) TaxID=446470 RepID=D3Q6Z3_STANL|nr:type VII secretion protein EccC [Stackebrandtia nassauensis]ADD40392.1 cell division FtsK/SpoIIIE [Stackebrandtia nassauensis DSM 44728]